jgi:hypothetical protein
MERLILLSAIATLIAYLIIEKIKNRSIQRKYALLSHIANGESSVWIGTVVVNRAYYKEVASLSYQFVSFFEAKIKKNDPDTLGTLIFYLYKDIKDPRKKELLLKLLVEAALKVPAEHLALIYAGAKEPSEDGLCSRKRKLSREFIELINSNRRTPESIYFVFN